MANSNPLNPRLLKGALIEFSSRFISSVPNVIIFQFNPETITRKLEPWYSGGSDKAQQSGKEAANAQPHDPPETFDLTLQFDATDELDNPLTRGIALVSGVSRRIAALEMLLYPQGDKEKLTGSAQQSLAGKATLKSSTSSPVPRGKVPDLLFCWGPSRIVPVRLTSFSVEEQAYSPQLSPIRAKVTVGMKILQPRDMPCSKEQSSDLLKTSYKIYTTTKQVLAAANMASQSADMVESILGLL
jgi:hypothetical protein